MKTAIAYNTEYSANIEADKDVLLSVDAVYNALFELGHDVIKIPVTKNISDDLKIFYNEKIDLVFNLVESINGQSSKELCFPAFLEMLDISYTGSSAKAISLALDKVNSKKIFLSSSIPTPDLIDLSLFSPDKGDKRGLQDLALKWSKIINYPVIIKPRAEDASIGINIDSIINFTDDIDINDIPLTRGTKRGLKDIQDKIIALEKIHGEMFIEEYICGREFNVSILENKDKSLEVLPIAELDFSNMPKEIPNICSYNGKWDENNIEYKGSKPVFDFKLDNKVLDDMKQISKEAFKVLGCSGYARVDIRTRDDIPYVLEVNPNPCITPGAGFVKSAEQYGLNYKELIKKIIGNCISQ